MRRIPAGLGMCLTVLAAGCHLGPHQRVEQPVANRVPPPTPSVTNLVKYLNDNASRVQAVQSNNMEMTARDHGQGVSLSGLMVCQKPRSFRLKAKIIAAPTVDIGSNDDEFWYWIGKGGPPYVFHCAYRDLPRVGPRLPFPFHPEIVVAALGMADYDDKAQYRLVEKERTLELVESTSSAQGQPMQKVTVFNRFEAKSPDPQVLEHILRDPQGQVVCKAVVHKVTIDRESGAILPVNVTLQWPKQQMELRMQVNDLHAVKIPTDRAQRMFSRADLARYESFDLARGALDTALQRTGGVSR
jgi:hypothetical protein